MKRFRYHSMKSRMVGIFVFCWLVPFLLLVGVVAHYMITNQTERKAEDWLQQLKFNNQICMERLEYVIRFSREATMDRVIERAYDNYLNEDQKNQILYAQCNNYIKERYQNNKCFMNTIYWNENIKPMIHASVYNTKAGGSYQQVQKYWSEDHEEVKQYAKTLDTKIGFYYVRGRFYMVRNLFDSSYQKIGTLVMQLNLNYCFEPFYTIEMGKAIIVRVNEQSLVLQGDSKTICPEAFEQRDSGYEWQDCFFVYDTAKTTDCTLSTLIAIEKRQLLTEFYGYQYLIFGMILCFIPLLFVVVSTWKKHISEPIEQLINASEEIKKGNLGKQLDYEAQNIEFCYLVDSFNQMSQKLKYQFDHIYEEELALKDAKIKALQSNINPHFMNNTLEIINWEARMGDNAKVSKMIEALSILMDVAIDRNSKPEVMLKEELIYVESYLYIIKERFGKRIQIEKQLEETLGNYLVPKLILQPVIENAVDHGVAIHGTGKIIIRSREDEHYLYLEIENDGEMTREDQEKIDKILSKDYDMSKEKSGNIGIANVNQRLKILYGEACGLQIRQTENGVLAILKIAKKQ